MCKHVLNSQVYFQAKCCKKWFECTECHDENSDHKYQFSSHLRFTCKNCRACFDRNFKHFSDRDKFCSVCATPWVIPGITPESKLFEASNQIISSCIEEITSMDHPYFASLE